MISVVGVEPGAVITVATWVGCDGMTTTDGAVGGLGAMITDAPPSGGGGTTAAAGVPGVMTTAGGALAATITVVVTSSRGCVNARLVSCCAEAGVPANAVIAAVSTGNAAHVRYARNMMYLLAMATPHVDDADAGGNAGAALAVPKSGSMITKKFPRSTPAFTGRGTSR
jgi:hypothetical protein